VPFSVRTQTPYPNQLERPFTSRARYLSRRRRRRVGCLIPSRLVKCWYPLGAICADSRTDYSRSLRFGETLVRD
jgi:hypothetical protein